MNDSTRLMGRPRRGWPVKARPATAIVVLTGLVVLAAACGGSPSSTGGAANAGGSTPAHLTNSEKTLAFADCMRTHGVPNFPDPNSGGGFNKTTLAQLVASNSHYQAAADDCHHLLPTPSVAQQRNIAAQALQFSRCMRTHGITNFPDPDNSGRIPDPATLGIDQGSPRFEAANQACGRYRPPYMPSNAAYNAYARTNG